MTRTRTLAASVGVLLAVCGISHAGLPHTILYDDFDDGNHDGWVVKDPMAYDPSYPVAGPVMLQLAHDNWAVATPTSTGGLVPVAFLYHPVDIDSAQVCVEMRAKTTGTVHTWLCHGGEVYMFGQAAGHAQVEMSKFTKDPMWWGFIWTDDLADPFGWHELEFSRDEQGWWSFGLDGSLVEADFAHDTEWTAFDGVELYFIATLPPHYAVVDWVRVSIPEPAALALVVVGGVALIRRK